MFGFEFGCGFGSEELSGRYEVEVYAGRNVDAVRESDVVILWCAFFFLCLVVKKGINTKLTFSFLFFSSVLSSPGEQQQLQTPTSTLNPKRRWAQRCFGR